MTTKIMRNGLAIVLGAAVLMIDAGPGPISPPPAVAARRAMWPSRHSRARALSKNDPQVLGRSDPVVEPRESQ